MAKYDLSVAIIFKNEIRCLERCLKSLQPLRERLSLQIVMADTGSTDGSHAVAERYADVLFDFPWVNDFAAARNATLDRCRGRWTLVMDCDEWLDADMDELVWFLKSASAKKQDAALLTIRNYSTPTFDRYTEFNAFRLVNMAVKPRYGGAIHEQIIFRGSISCQALKCTLLHHDGYVMLNDGSEAGKAKTERNLQLLRESRERDPDDLRTLALYLDCATAESDYLDTLRHAVKLVQDEQGDYRRFGAPLLRVAIEYAYRAELPELAEWGRMCRERFPDSYFTMIDANYILLLQAHDEKNYRELVLLGEEFLAACARLENDINGWAELRFGVLQHRGEHWSAIVAGCVAEAYYHLGAYDRVFSTLKTISWEGLDATGVRGILTILCPVHEKTELDTGALLSNFWEGILVDKPTKEAAEERKKEFLSVGKQFLAKKQSDAPRSVQSLFLALRGKCVLGDYAALASTRAPEEADALLADIKNLTELPTPALVHALRIGAEFPPPDRRFPMEFLDTMASKLSTDEAFLREAVIYTADAFETGDDLNWARALALAALQANDWTADPDPMPLLRAVVKIESTFLARCYSVQALQYQGYLPPLHRFALHLLNAFAVLAPSSVSPEFTPTVTGGVRGALAELKEAVVAAPEQKRVVDVVLDNLLKQ